MKDNTINLKIFFNEFFSNIGKCFWKYNLLWHLLAIILTYGIVTSGFDWWYFTHSRGVVLQSFLFPAVFLGMLLPVFVPIIIYVYGAINKNIKWANIAAALGQSAIVGLLVSWLYKALTGRAHPIRFVSAESAIDISKIFRFGFLRGGVFWGWPSSHTTVAFAMSVALFTLFPKNKLVQFVSIAYALYIGIGISTSIHWFSDFVAGVIFGSMVGVVVGKSFLKRSTNLGAFSK